MHVQYEGYSYTGPQSIYFFKISDIYSYLLKVKKNLKAFLDVFLNTLCMKAHKTTYSAFLVDRVLN